MIKFTNGTETRFFSTEAEMRQTLLAEAAAGRGKKVNRLMVGMRVQGQINVFVGTNGHNGNGYQPKVVSGTITKVLSAGRVAVRWDHQETGECDMAMNKKDLRAL